MGLAFTAGDIRSSIVGTRREGSRFGRQMLLYRKIYISQFYDSYDSNKHFPAEWITAPLWARERPKAPSHSCYWPRPTEIDFNVGSLCLQHISGDIVLCQARCFP
jgi:hypothetical protein